MAPFYNIELNEKVQGLFLPRRLGGKKMAWKIFSLMEVGDTNPLFLGQRFVTPYPARPGGGNPLKRTSTDIVLLLQVGLIFHTPFRGVGG